MKEFVKQKSVLFQFLAIFICSAWAVQADEFDEFDEDEPATVVYLKKIRDDQGNYLPEVTKATARAVKKSGEFLVKRYKRKTYSEGPVISVGTPEFNFTPFKDGMSKKEMATVGLSIAADVGELFGYKKNHKVREAQYRVANQGNALSQFSDKQKILVTMSSRVEVYDDETGDEVTRDVKIEQVFKDKQVFLEQKSELIKTELVKAVKMAMVEFSEDME